MASSSSRIEQTSTDHSSLYEAIKSGDIDSLKQLLVITAPKSDEFDVDNPLLRQNHFNNNSLHVAVQLSETETLVKEIFKQCGSSKSLEMLMQQNMNGDTPLHIAVRMGSEEIVRLFLNHAGRDYQAIDHYNQRGDEECVHIDVEKGVTMTELLPEAENGATKMNVEQLVRIANKMNNTALHEAIRYQAESRIPQLLIRADPGFDYLANDSGETPLYLAVSFGTSTLVEHILKIRPTQSYGAPGGRTVLHALALQRSFSNSSFEGNNYSNIVHLLRHIVKEVDINGRTALHYAVHSRNSEFVDAVMEVDPSVCYISDKDGMTALHHAAAADVGPSSITESQGIKEIMKIMLRHCMDCWGVVDNRGDNFLHIAAQNNNSYVLEFVLKEINLDLAVNAIIGTKNKYGRTPAQINTEFFKILDSNARMRGIWRSRSSAYGISFKSYETPLNKQSEKYRKAAERTEAEEAAEIKEVNKMKSEQMEYYNQTLLVVSALIATVAFAANFTLPGGYNDHGPDEGMALLADKPSFIVFIVSNSLAMVLSALAILIQFVGKIISIILREPDEFKKGTLLFMTLHCNVLAILAMMVAFVTGNYTVLSHLPGLAIPVCILGSVFFILSFFLIYKILKWVKQDDVNWHKG
ncbi:hypothetical protein C5167_025886 [Papaver somniferum]|uniref:PGG domain-containing protein n=1 Tax=Papaver somniferum TaxID=3469 RepID=A0A4Y7JWK7_PAPSO|nr:ankyrin repeat-containing protein At5g02620-like [Papaver somniferum]RZC64148.1 hypothetical protein C5167_025886 [Papaver somniferum]